MQRLGFAQKGPVAQKGGWLHKKSLGHGLRRRTGGTGLEGKGGRIALM